MKISNIQRIISGCIFILVAAVNSGCTVVPIGTTAPVGMLEPGGRIIKLTAIGYGASSSLERYAEGQKKLMAMRASKLDAYRSMAEQVYGVRISGNSTVGAMMVTNDSFRSQIDAYIRGAQVVNISQIADGNYETTIEMDFDESFIKPYMNKASNRYLDAQNRYQVDDSKNSVGPGSLYGTRYYQKGSSYYYSE